MSGVTKGQLEAQNAELLEAIKRLEKMNVEVVNLSRTLRKDVDEVEMAAAWYKRQRDNLVGFLQGYRKDIEGSITDEPLDTYGPPRIQISRVDAFLGDCREDPPIRDGVRRL